MPTLTLNIKATSADASVYATAGNSHKCLPNIRNLIEGLMSGAVLGSVDAQVSSANPVAASGTATLVYGSMSANDTITIGSQTFTAVASGATANQFNLVTDSTTTATNLAAAINASTTIGKHVVATSALGVVTITARLKGSIGNQIVMSKSSSGVTLVQLSGGTGGPESTVATYGR